MLEDDEREVLHTLMSELNDGASESSTSRMRAALGKVLQLEAWLSSAQFRTALAATIRGSTKTVLDQRRLHGTEITHALLDSLAKEIGNNAAGTVVFLLEPPGD